MRGFYGVVLFFERGGCGTSADGSGDVAPVAGFSGPWKYVDDDGFAGAEWPFAAFVRVGGREILRDSDGEWGGLVIGAESSDLLARRTRPLEVR